MTDFEEADFEFKTMHTAQIQLFQVYVKQGGKKIRFHMQKNSDDKVYIADKQACPGAFHQLETH